MALTAGTRLGPYEILSPLGAGGMGEVYKARDTRLDRQVAVKVLPPELSASAEFRERFEREARIISQLTHPHICALFDVGSQDGVEYLVMELLEGETLADRLDKGPVPTEWALRLGVEIAGALAHAHRAGIVHRDLKPGNVMLTRSGVKLLDFGLAKVRPPLPITAPFAASRVPTQAHRNELTGHGVMIGTIQYMAPEQLEGKEVDTRTDIFAFGCLLYEMATGRKAFAAESQASLIAAIMSSEPPPIGVLRPLSPPALDRVVRTCLAKDPEERWQSAQDLAGQLQGLLEAGSQASSPAVPAAPRRRRWAGGTLLALAAAGALALAARRFAAHPGPALVLKSSISPPESSAFTIFGDPSGPAVISPDGRAVAFVASTAGRIQLWIRRLDALQASPLAGTEQASYPFWSADSKSIGFFADGKLKRIAAAGGAAPQTLAEAPTGRGGAWSRDGTIVFAPEASGPLYRIPAAGGKPSAVTRLDPSRGVASHRWPHFLPDGRRFLYYSATVRLQGKTDADGIFAGSIDGGESVFLLHSDSAGVYAPPGYLLTVRGSTLQAVRFDPSRLGLSGEPVPVAGPVQRDWGRFLGGFSASDNGLLLYHGGSNAGSAELCWFDRAGRRIESLGDPAIYSEPSLSPDGKRVAVGVLDAATLNFQIAVRGAAPGPTTRFTFGPSSSGFPIWSPDGSQIVFSSNRTGLGDLYAKPASGTKPERRLQPTDGDAYPLDWSRDGRYIVYGLYSKSARRSELWVLPTFGEAKPYRLFTEGIKDPIARFSPDGRWLAYNSYESGISQIYVASFPDAAGKWQISQAGGFEPRWSRDGRRLYFLSLDSSMMEVEARAGSTFEPGPARSLFPVPVGAQTSEWAYDVSPDEKRFLIVVPGGREGGSSPLTLVTNWAEEIQKP